MGADSARKTVNRKLMLVLSPHPDDMELSAGLLCHRAVQLGWTVCEVTLTDGSAGGIDNAVFHTSEHVRNRSREALKAARALGVSCVIPWNYPDGRLDERLPNAENRMVKLLKRVHPQVVVFPSASDTHVDHAATHRIALSALEKTSWQAHQLQYCFWGNDDSQNVVLSHAEGVPTKLAAIRCHATQPIEKYLTSKYGENMEPHDTECFYSPTVTKTLNALASWGFSVTRST